VVLNSHVSRAWAPSRPPVELQLIPEPRQGMAPDAFVKHPGATCHRVGLGAKLSGGKHNSTLERSGHERNQKE
jgi:hypothetical protein